MRSFRTVTSVAAPYVEADMNTDIIFPARFLLLPNKEGLGAQLFNEKRHGSGPAFVLDKAPYDAAEILVAGPNFGCGSSREQAVWALADFGIRCVVAPSFGEIFYANCFKNGVLPIVVAQSEHGALVRAANAAQAVTVDLETQTISFADTTIGFDVDPERRDALLKGLDEIGTILESDLEDIERFERSHRATRPWLFLQPDQLGCFADLAGEDAISRTSGSPVEYNPQIQGA